MSGEAITRLRTAPYVSLETFRQSGKGVPTPVWCAPEGEAFYVFSAGDAGKVKRLRNGNRVRLAVCDVRGRLLGPWHDGRAEILDTRADIEKALQALRSKYRWQMWVADVGARLSGRFAKRAYIRVELTGA